jgi:iron complex outermembrane recepter protein
MKTFYILSTCLLMALSGFAQSQLTGTVLDQEQNPIQAQIFITQLDQGAITNRQGLYQFNNIPSGAYAFVVRSLGYQTIEQEIFVDAQLSDQIADFVMTSTAIEMTAIFLSVPFHKLQDQQVMPVESVDFKNASEQGISDVNELLNTVPGVSVLSTGPSIGKAVIRGLSGNRVVTYDQGIRLENQQFGEEHGIGLVSDGIDRVEVIKGPASLLYGSDALGGVLYFVPERFAPKNSEALTLRSRFQGNTRGVHQFLGYKNSGVHTKLMVSGSVNSQEDYKIDDNLYAGNSRSFTGDFKTGYQWRIDRWKSTMRYHYNRTKLGLAEEMVGATGSRQPDLPSQEIVQNTLSWENNFYLDQGQLDVTFGASTNNRQEFEDFRTEPALHMYLKTKTLNLLYHLPESGKFETIIGTQNMWQTNTNKGDELLIPDAQKTDLGFFATTHLHGDILSLQGGLRYDYRGLITKAMGPINSQGFVPVIDRAFHAINGALGMLYNIDDNILIRLNVASGYRAPNLAELGSNGIHEGTNRYEIGNPDLKNERNVQLDLALTYENEHLNTYLNGFYNVIDDYIFITPTQEVLEQEPVFRYAQFNAALYGGEAGFHYHPHPWDWLHLENSLEWVIGMLDNGSPLPLIPGGKLNNTLRIKPQSASGGHGLFFNISRAQYFAQNRASDFETTTGAYHLWDISLGQKFEWGQSDWQWVVAMANASNTKYIPHLSRFKTDGIFNPGRSLNLSLSVTL